jgi:hypothetical protein
MSLSQDPQILGLFYYHSPERPLPRPFLSF